MEHKYAVAYHVIVGEFTQEELRNLSINGCDAIIVHSILYQPDGSQSEMIISRKAGGDELSPEQLWQSWAIMAHQLSVNEGLDTERREMCLAIYNQVNEFLAKQRSKT